MRPPPTPRGPQRPGDGQPDAPGLRRLNSLEPHRAEKLLLRCCASPRWAARIAAHRPYPDTEALLAAADEAAYDLTPGELAEALAGESALHPLTDSPGALAAHTALRAAHAAYESRFGHAFVICLDDCAAEEVLDRTLSSVHTRLGNDPEEERARAAEELRRLARGRLARRAAAGEGRRSPAEPGNTGPYVPD